MSIYLMSINILFRLSNPSSTSESFTFIWWRIFTSILHQITAWHTLILSKLLYWKRYAKMQTDRLFFLLYLVAIGFVGSTDTILTTLGLSFVWSISGNIPRTSSDTLHRWSWTENRYWRECPRVMSNTLERRTVLGYKGFPTFTVRTRYIPLK